MTQFGGLTIAFDHQVLQPRPWTVIQSAWAAELLRSAPPGDVLELCAGVGHIGLLAVSGTERRLVLVDSNKVACEFARTNAEAARRPAGSVEIRHGRIDQVLDHRERFALIIADPPWVPSGETARHPEDPLTAIDGGSEGMDVVRTCLGLAGAHLLPGGAAVLQVGSAEQVRAVSEHLDRHPDVGLQVVRHHLAQHGALVHLVPRELRASRPPGTLAAGGGTLVRPELGCQTPWVGPSEAQPAPQPRGAS